MEIIKLSSTTLRKLEAKKAKKQAKSVSRDSNFEEESGKNHL